MALHLIRSKFSSRCYQCRKAYSMGATICWDDASRKAFCNEACYRDFRNDSPKLPESEAPPRGDTSDISLVDVERVFDAKIKALKLDELASDAVLKVCHSLSDVIKQQFENEAQHATARLEQEIERLAKLAVKEIVVVKDGDKETKLEGVHFMFPRLLTLAMAGIHVYLHGPAGTGKTTAALQVGQALNRNVEIDTLDRSTFASRIQGFLSPHGEKVETAFSRCWTNGGIYVADELDNAPGQVQTLKNSSLANGIAPLAWGNVKKHDNFVYIGCGNTPFRPTAAYPDRQPGSAAFIDRLYFLYWPRDRNLMRSHAGMPNEPRAERPKPRKIENSAWERWCEKAEDWCEQNAPQMKITSRAYWTGVKALACGETPYEVADGMVFRGCDDDLRSKLLNAVPLP